MPSIRKRVFSALAGTSVNIADNAHDSGGKPIIWSPPKTTTYGGRVSVTNHRREERSTDWPCVGTRTTRTAPIPNACGTGQPVPDSPHRKSKACRWRPFHHRRPAADNYPLVHKHFHEAIGNFRFHHRFQETTTAHWHHGRGAASSICSTTVAAVTQP